MRKIVILSDTHGHIDSKIYKYLHNCDEVWHAGDIGQNNEVEKFLSEFKVRAVYGNIDGMKLRKLYPRVQKFNCEGLKVIMTHIGGYPGNYVKKFKEQIQDYKPDIVVTGHSHILKVKHDKINSHLFINPGSCGIEGFHKKKTIVLLEINESKILNLKVVELGNRSQLS
tara:strand:- start:2010 stop:2516 length:507 start_codon:yes stop_codon:yes gene_type:complete